MRSITTAIVFALGTIAAAWQGQTTPSFEVASVKPHGGGDRNETTGVQPGRYIATNVTLRTLIVNAYALQDEQLAGGPAWVKAAHYDIVAKVPASASPDVSAMLRALITDRFRLATHTERREMPIYELVTARTDRKLGPQMHDATVDCSERAETSTTKTKEGKDKSKEVLGTRSTAQAVSHQRSPCKAVIEPGHVSARGMTMAIFASRLSGVVPRTVIDRTGLAGTYDLELTWTPDRIRQDAGLVAKGKSRTDPNGPSLFTAVQEQLGLKLQSARGPVEVLVIDHAEQPTAD